MDRIANYEKIILKLLREYLDYWSRGQDHAEIQLITDLERKHYQLVRFGWTEGYDFVHYPLYHLFIRNGKIWIQANNTDRSVADDLVAAGVPKAEIVLGVLHPEDRAYSEYGVG